MAGKNNRFRLVWEALAKFVAEKKEGHRPRGFVGDPKDVPELPVDGKRVGRALACKLPVRKNEQRNLG